MLKQLASVRASDLEQALLILPFSDALRLLSYFCTWLERGAEVSCHILCSPCTPHGSSFPPEGMRQSNLQILCSFKVLRLRSYLCMLLR